MRDKYHINLLPYTDIIKYCKKYFKTNNKPKRGKPKVYEDYFKQIGIPEEKIHAIGTPIYDNLKTLNSIDSGEDYVLLATSGPTNEVAVDLAIENIEKNIATIKKIAETVVSHNKK